MTGRPSNVGNKLLAALPPADFHLLSPHLQNIAFEVDAALVQSGDELNQVYFPDSGAIAFMAEMPNGQTVATTLMGPEGAVGSLTVLGPSHSPVTAIARVAGTASQISVAKLQSAYRRSAAIRHVVHVHIRTQILQLQQVAACNALHPVEQRMARWLLELHDHVADDVLPVTQEALAHLLGVRRTTVTLAMSKLRAAGALKSDRRGLVEIDRAQLEHITCDCYTLMRSRIGPAYDKELSKPPRSVAPFEETRPEVKAARAERP